MRTSSKLNVLAGLLALVLVSAMVYRTSSAAFTGSTSNTDNSWSAGTVSLTDSDSGSALFSASNLKPGDSSTQCIEVTYSGSITPSAAVTLAAVKTDTVGGGTGDGLSDDLDVTVRLGNAGVTCALLTDLNSSVIVNNLTLAAFESGGNVNTWTPAIGSDTVRAFQFAVTFGADAANDAQGDSSTASFTWSATS